MNELMSLLSSLGTTQILGVGGVIIAIAGYSGLKVVKYTKRVRNKRLRAKKFEVKSNITNDAYKGNPIKDTPDFDPETYTVNTEDYTLGPKKVSGPILRPRNSDIDSFLNADLPLSGTANHDSAMRTSLEEQAKAAQSIRSSYLDSQETQHERHQNVSLTATSKYLTANPDSRRFINKAIDFAKNKNKEKVIENLKLAIEKEPNQNEKLRFSTIIKNYSNGREDLISLFSEYPSFLDSDEEQQIIEQIALSNAQDNLDNADFEDAKNKAQEDYQENFSYKEISRSPVDRFSHLTNNLTAPNITVSGQSKVRPTINELPSTVPNISTDKTLASDINEVSGNFSQTAHIQEDDISNIFKSISILNSTSTGEVDMTQNTQLANDFNNLLNDFHDPAPKPFGATEEPRRTAPNRLAYDIWVQWMTTANGKTSFKSSMYKLENPWTSRKAIIELTEKVAQESKNSDGTNAAWSVISVQPFFDI